MRSRPDNGADVGHGQRGQRHRQVLHGIGRLRRVHHPVIDDAVHRDRRVVPRDDGLLGDVEHLFLHVHPPADAVDEGDDEVQPRAEHAGEGAEALHRPDFALRDRSDAAGCRQHGDEQQHDQDDRGAGDDVEQVGVHGRSM
jgi:hypothetical protein